MYLGIDAGLTAAAFLLAYFAKKYWLPFGLAGLPTRPNYYFLLLLAVVVLALSYQFHGFYTPTFRFLRPAQLLGRVVKAVTAGFACYLLALYLVHQQDISRLMMLLFVGLTIFFLFCVKIALARVEAFQVSRDAYQKKLLIVGSRARAKELVTVLQQRALPEYQLLGCLETERSRLGQEVAPGVAVIGLVGEMRDILLGKAVDEVIYAMPLDQVRDIRTHIAFAEQLGVRVRILPDWQIQKIMYHPEAARIYFEDFLGLPTVALSSTPAQELQLFFKAIMDYAGAALALILLSPLFAVIAILIKATSPGPVFFTQERCGLNGRRFRLYKFRTMVEDAEELRAGLTGQNEMDGPVFKMRNDPRLVGIGRFLRTWSLDELPQLINILRGEMSLVGPRPPIPEEVARYRAWQRRRLSMKPGLTCIWQISGRNNIDFERWMRLDLEYIDNWSLLLDLKILLLTVPAVLKGSGR
ncbi:MAG: sugar transferase [Thermodesulfobacteriota bacterium]